MSSANDLVLTGALDRWELILRSGETVTVWAHGVSEREGDYVFVALMRGVPHFEVELCRVPVAIVSDLTGG